MSQLNIHNMKIFWKGAFRCRVLFSCSYLKGTIVNAFSQVNNLGDSGSIYLIKIWNSYSARFLVIACVSRWESHWRFHEGFFDKVTHSTKSAPKSRSLVSSKIILFYSNQFSVGVHSISFILISCVEITLLQNHKNLTSPPPHKVSFLY